MSTKPPSWGVNTLAIHAGQAPDPATGAVATPIYQTTTFAYESAEQGARRFTHQEEGYIYTRYGNPTTAAFEQKIAALEGGEAAQGVASGMAAVTTTVLSQVRAGDHVIVCDSVYSSTYTLFAQTLPSLGVEVSFVDSADPESFRAARRPNTRMMYLETPGNPTLKLVDLDAVVPLAREAGALTVLDNTFATPINQRPMEWGVDVVLHSATKYLGGHGDLIGGVVIGSQEFIDRLWTTHIEVGGVLSPFHAFLLVRGMQTLPLRIQRHNANALAIAQFLEGHPAVERVLYPGLPSHPQHRVAQQQMGGFGGMVCFEVRGGVDAGRRLMNAVQLCTLTVSLGDTKTLICHPASMTHSQVPPEDRLRSGITDGLVRLSVGLEDASDLISDLDQALSPR